MRKSGWVSWVLVVALVLCGLAAAGLALHWYYIAVREAFGGARDASSFGDAFGAFSALASALATIGVVAALLLQQKQLTLQREELAMQRVELRKAAEAQAAQVEVLQESAKAARAQAAAFGAEGVERFLELAESCRQTLIELHVRVHLGTSEIEAHELSSLRFPALPIFCASPVVVSQASAIQEQLRQIKSRVASARFLQRVVLAPRASSEHLESSMQNLRAHGEITDQLLVDLHRGLRELETAASAWFLDRNAEPVESGERPVTTPEEQAS